MHRARLVGAQSQHDYTPSESFARRRVHERRGLRLLDGHGDLLPVSAMPVDGTFPTNTAKVEKRSIAHEIPIWDPDICIECGLCVLVCPHAAIRSKAYPRESLTNVPGR